MMKNKNVNPAEDTDGIWFGVRNQNDSAYVEIKSGALMSGLYKLMKRIQNMGYVIK
jgi:hypothetical protein